MLKVFLSYHHNARKTASRVKDFLGTVGVDVFLAHEDLEPSAEWQKEILRELRRCDVFIPLLTRNFHSSLWTDQETGIAVAWKKLILPLKFSTDPYGFIGKYQALKARKEFQETCWKIVHNLASKPVFGKDVKDGAISAFLASSSFDQSRRFASALLTLEPFSITQLNRIVGGGAKNDQIYGGWAARDVVKKLISRNRAKLKRSLVGEFKRQVEYRG